MEKAPTSQQDEYREWMIVTWLKQMNRTHDKLNGPSRSQIDESSQMLYEKTLPRAGEVDRAAGKRKAPQIQAARSPREESKNTLSYHNKIVDGKGLNRNGSRANPRQKAKVTVGNHKSVMGLGKEEGTFVFGATTSPSKDTRLSQSPFPFSNIARSEARPEKTSKEGESNALSFSNHGESREVGIVL